MRETGNFTKKQVFERTGFLRNLKKTLIQEEYKELLDEIEQCNTVQERLKGNVRNFLIRQGIHHVKEIDYRIRELYESELRRTKTSSKGLEYLKTLDRIKQFDIRKEMETLSGRNKERLKYEGQVIYGTRVRSRARPPRASATGRWPRVCWRTSTPPPTPWCSAI